MKCKTAVTFEFTEAAPVTIRGEHEATSPRTIVARAVDEAITSRPRTLWSSMVVLIEKIGE